MFRSKLYVKFIISAISYLLWLTYICYKPNPLPEQLSFHAIISVAVGTAFGTFLALVMCESKNNKRD